MPRLPRTISLSRLSEMPSRSAAWTCPKPRGLRYSSSRISPGGIAGPSQSGSLVIILDADFVGMATLPPERHPVLVIHSNTVALGSLALQALKSIARRSRQVVEAGGCIQAFEFPLHDAPEFTWNAPGGPRVSFPEEVRGGLVRE